MKKWKLVYECSSEQQRDLWKQAFDAVIAAVQRLEEEE